MWLADSLSFKELQDPAGENPAGFSASKSDYAGASWTVHAGTSGTDYAGNVLTGLSRECLYLENDYDMIRMNFKYSCINIMQMRRLCE